MDGSNPCPTLRYTEDTLKSEHKAMFPTEQWGYEDTQSRPRPQHFRGQGRMQRGQGRGRNYWTRGRGHFEDLTSLIITKATRSLKSGSIIGDLYTHCATFPVHGVSGLSLW